MKTPPCSGTTKAKTLEELIERDKDHECEGFGGQHICVRAEAVAELPSRFGQFRIVAFWNNRDGKEHVAVVHGDVQGAEDVPMRIHSECLTGDALGSLRCDCREQLEVAMQQLGSMPRGLLLYLRQEGRGIGLINKIRAYALQDRGLDTVEANRELGFRDDERDYAVAAHMLMSLDVRSVKLMTNNPNKVQQLEHHGIRVSGRIPHVMPANEHNRFYLETKATRSGHHIELDRQPRLLEQDERVLVEGMDEEPA
jgi:GTP cyclohydrolase II